MDGLGARIDGCPGALGYEVGEGVGGAHVVHVAAVGDTLPAGVHLRLVLVVSAIPSPIEVVLVLAPRDTRHAVADIALLGPGADAVGQRWAEAIGHNHVHAQIEVWGVRHTRLHGGALPALAWIVGAVTHLFGSPSRRIGYDSTRSHWA